MPRSPNSLVAVLLVLMIAGCGDSGPDTFPVKGVVRYQGKPLPLGTLMFVPEDGPPVSATIGADGAYELTAVPGKHRVEIVAMPPVEGGKPDPTKEGGIDYTGVVFPKSLIPEKYNRYATSEVEVEVQPIEANQIDIELK